MFASSPSIYLNLFETAEIIDFRLSEVRNRSTFYAADYVFRLNLFLMIPTLHLFGTYACITLIGNNYMSKTHNKKNFLWPYNNASLSAMSLLVLIEVICSIRSNSWIKMLIDSVTMFHALLDQSYHKTYFQLFISIWSRMVKEKQLFIIGTRKVSSQMFVYEYNI